MAQVEKLISLSFCSFIGPCQNRKGPQLVSAHRALFGRNMLKTISPRLSSNSTSGLPEFSEYFITSLSAEKLLENLSIDFIFSSGLRGMTERKTKKIEVSFELETRSNRLAKFYNVLQSNYCIKTSL